MCVFPSYSSSIVMRNLHFFTLVVAPDFISFFSIMSANGAGDESPRHLAVRSSDRCFKHVSCYYTG